MGALVIVGARGLESAPRVLLVTHPAGAGGGIATFTEHLVHHLRARADVITLPYSRIYPGRSAPGREERRRVTAPPRGAPTVYLPWTWPRSLAQVFRLRPALVVVQWWHPTLAPFLLALVKVAHMCGARLAVVCHNTEPHERFPASRALTRVMLRSADMVWTLSSYAATDVRRIAPDTSVAALSHPPNVSAAGAGTPSTRAATPAAVTQREGGPALLFFGYVRPYKGLDDLLEALALMKSTPPATLTVAGPFYQPVEQVRRHIAELRLTERVRLLDGYVLDEDVAGLFAAADLVVLPYRSASQSGVLSLAAEFARPVVATDVGSLAADLRGHGLIAPPRNPVALAGVLDRAVTRMPASPPVPGDWTPWADAVISAATAPPVNATRRQSSRLARLAWATVLVCTAAVFARSIASSHVQTWPGPRALAVAAAALVVARLAHVTQWHLLIRGHGARLPLRTSARILTTAELARFVPGGIWHFVAGFRLATRAGVPSPVIVVTMCRDLALRLAAAFAVFLVTIAAWPHVSSLGLIAGAAGATAAAVVAHPRSVRALAGALTRRQPEPTVTRDLPGTLLLATFAVSVSIAVARGLAAVALVAGVVPGIGLRAALTIVGAVSLSWSLGVLVPFAPGGLGVQEASGAAVIALIAPAAVAAATIIVLRVLMVGVEAATAGLAYAADSNRRGALHRASRAPSHAAPRAASHAPDDVPGELSAPAKPEEVAR